MALAPGSRLGPYEVVASLGAGGMGEVYRAFDTRLERTVAIKILPEHRSSSGELRARFEREARAVSSLNHPHICHLYDIGSQDGTAYLVMEYLEGETLADCLRKGALPLNQIVGIRDPDHGGSRNCAPWGHSSPRSEAGKHNAHPKWCQALGFWTGEGGSCSRYIRGRRRRHDAFNSHHDDR